METVRSLFRWFSTRLNVFFTFNRSEQRGIFALCFLLLGLVAANGFFPSATSSSPAESSAFVREVEQFEAAYARAAAEDSLSRRMKGASGFDRKTTPHGDTSAKMAEGKRPSFLVELNVADTLELQRLRGIGPAFARRIVQYRERLGGFTEVNQLLEVYGMDQQRLGYIAPYLTVNSDSVKRVDLNKAPFKVLLRHPYFPYPVARNIILWREKHKRFSAISELNDIDGVTDSLFRKISAYVLIR